MSENSQRKLFEEFPPVSTENWEDKIRVDLKEADYAKKLVWKTIEGIDVKPFYRNEDLNNLDYLESKPGDSPFVRGNSLTSNDWDICQQINVSQVETANKEALSALHHGATSVEFILQDGVDINQSYLTELLKNIPIEKTGLNFYSQSSNFDLLKTFLSELETRDLLNKQVKGGIGYDPIGEFALIGKFRKSEQEAFNELTDMFNLLDKKLAGYKILALNGKYFKNAGSTIVQELGYTLAVGAEYLSYLTESGFSIDEITRVIQINFAVGSHYFMEIAKIRAARLLWSKIVEAYEPNKPDSAKVFIHTETSDWNKTVFDPYVNLLRCTTEAMSASLGGVDSMTVFPFDSIYKKSTGFSQRLSRNIQIILKEEAYFNRVTDAAAGSYYLENLTDSLAGEAWKLFLDIEKKGGFITAFKKGLIQSEIEDNARQRDENISYRRKNFLGTNQYPNLTERISENIESSIYQKKGIEGPKDGANPLKIYRAAENFEKLRLTTEQFHGGIPKVFLFKVGNLSLRMARATFASNFFGCAGFKIIEGSGCQSVEEGLDEYRSHKADVVVICSSDTEYKQFVPELFSEVEGKALFVIAGYPSDLVKQFQDLGIQFFIHTRTNVLKTLQEIQHTLRIE